MASRQGIVRSGRRMRIECAVSLTARPSRETSAALETGGRDGADDDLALALDHRLDAECLRPDPERDQGEEMLDLLRDRPEAILQLLRACRRAAARPRPRQCAGTWPAAARCRRCSRSG